VNVLSVKVTAMPFTNTNGGVFDNNSGPDVYYQFTDASDVNILKPNDYYPNVTAAQLPLLWTLSPSFRFNNLSAQVKLKIWDYDGNDVPPNPDDYIDGYQFSFASYAALGYPSVITIQTSPTATLKYELQLQWQ
jgi:hypothetical protein